MRQKIKFSLWLIVALAALSPPGKSAPTAEGEAPDWNKLMESAVRAEKYGQALDYLSRIELQEPGNPSVRTAKGRLLTLLGRQLYQEKNYSQARDILLDALDLNPANHSALVTLGEIAYYTQRLEEAENYWTKALALQPGDQGTAQLLKRLKKEEAVEGKLDFSSLANFDIRFHAGAEDYDIYDIQSYLLEAYREIGYDFGFYPNRSLVVILYTKEEFDRLRSTPGWVGGIYDGKIRLPVKSGRLTSADFKRILWHEYTHALIHDLAGNNCPTWLHEGLAQYEEAKVAGGNRRSLQTALEEGALLGLSELNGAFAFNQPPEKVNLAYAQAYSLTEYLINKYGFWRINPLLERMKKGGGWKKAFYDELIITVPEIEKGWRRELEAGF